MSKTHFQEVFETWCSKTSWKWSFSGFDAQKHISSWTSKVFDVQELMCFCASKPQKLHFQEVFEHQVSKTSWKWVFDIQKPLKTEGFRNLMFKNPPKINFLPFRCAKTHWFLHIKTFDAKKKPLKKSIPRRGREEASNDLGGKLAWWVRVQWDRGGGVP